MTQEASNTLLLWIFGGLAVIGVYVVVTCPILLVLHWLNKVPTPIDGKKENPK